MAGRILIVDDDPLLCSLLRMALNREGFETHEVFSGKAALEYLSGALVDLVLLDVMMADFNGFDVLRMIGRPRPNGAGDPADRAGAVPASDRVRHRRGRTPDQTHHARRS